MHIPDGFVSGATSLGAGLVAVGGVGAALRQTSRTLKEKQIPMLGIVAAFIFALQMLNFPVAAGTSGHLIGGALAAILVGPAAGIVVMAVVVPVQALLFADGGVSALGLNIINMSLIAVLVGWFVFRGVMRVMPRRTAPVIGAAMAAAWVSVVAASIGFVIEYAIGGNGGASVTTVFRAMVGVHALVGIGEGLITGAVVGTVLAARRDLVFGVVDMDLARGGPSAPSRRAVGGFVAAGLIGAVLLTVFVAPLANPNPDGLERVATDQGFGDTATEHAIADSPLADYGVSGVESDRTGTVIAGIIGVAITFTIAGGLFLLFHRRNASSEHDNADAMT